MFRKIAIVCSLLALLTSCSVRKNVPKSSFASESQKKTIEKFFRNVLFYEGGIYTLLGTKPITNFDLFESDALPDLSHFADYKLYLNKNNQADLKLYSSMEKKTNIVLVSDQDYIFDAASLWREWEGCLKEVNLSKKYLLIKKEYTNEEKQELDPQCKNAYHVVLVNTIETACLLENHYEIFKELVGRDFNPLEEVLDIENPNSELWQCLFVTDPKDCYRAKGLLLGCDPKDAQVFSWKYDRSLRERFGPDPANFLDQLEGYPTESLDDILDKEHPFSVTNFPLPAFVTFSPLGATRVKYEKEREMIMDFYKGKDFVETTMDILTNNKD